MKKTIFFLLFSMNLGGVEKSFFNLISDGKFKDTEIHLGLLKKEGEFLQELPSDIIIHECCKGLWNDINNPIHHLITNSLKTLNFKNAIIYTFHYFKYKISKNKLHFYKYILKEEPKINIEFDEAYAYAGPASIIDYYIVNKIKAIKKFGWVHFDISKFWVDSHLVKSIYPFYEKIFVVSKEAKLKFDYKFPELSNKTEVRYNIINKEEINKLAQTGDTFNDGFLGKRILTVGRLSKEKGQDLALQSLKILVDKDYNVRWYFIGEGVFLEECKTLVKELGIEYYVSFLGKKINPYAYMKDCDIYVQPSRHEGFCISLEEAKCFNLPIIVTNFSSSEELLKDYSHKTITTINEKSLAEGISKYL